MCSRAVVVTSATGTKGTFAYAGFKSAFDPKADLSEQPSEAPFDGVVGEAVRDLARIGYAERRCGAETNIKFGD